MIAEIGSTMLCVGLILGFVGAGGSGFIISILTVMFGFSIHIALGTALAAMVFSSLSGTVSHYREGNVDLKTGLVVGICGAASAWVASSLSGNISEDLLRPLTAGMLFLSSICLWMRMGVISRKKESTIINRPNGVRYWVGACAIGMVCGALTGLFGIGSTPFIQIGLMTLLGMSPRESAGNTMLVIVPIALAGGAGYFHLGYVNPKLLAGVVAGTMIGSYIGAKFTKRVPGRFLRTAMVMLPIVGGSLLVV